MQRIRVAWTINFLTRRLISLKILSLHTVFVFVANNKNADSKALTIEAQLCLSAKTHKSRKVSLLAMLQSRAMVFDEVICIGVLFQKVERIPPVSLLFKARMIYHFFF